MIMEKLKQFGLTTNESKAYIYLIKNGISTAYKISKESLIPNSKIYSVLESLTAKGFVKKYDGSPKKFVSVAPKIIFNYLKEKKEKELDNFINNSDRIMNELGELAMINKDEVIDKIKIVEGYKNYLNLSVSLHKNVRREWLTISELSTYKPHIDSYEKNAKDNVKIKILTSDEEATSDKLKVWKKINAEIRKIPLITTKFTIIDDSDVTIRIVEGDKYLSLWIKNDSLADSLKKYFYMLWESGEKIK
ncbi:TrmB family transcriptional regulator [archaeon]|jgi:HTH-type transcriptional regulator, sugar sensing transcriptional regulator|nr:TrmB family transcriptional regulator [archaeon]